MLLFLSSVQFIAVAIVFGASGKTEGDKLISAGCTAFAGFALALGLAFCKAGAPTWRHKLAVAVVALPAALTILAG